MVLLDEHRRHVDVNGAYLRLAGYARDEVIGRPVWEYIEGGPQLTERQWELALARGELSGHAGLVCADGSIVTVQFAGHTEVATGQRLVLFVVLSTSRWGRHSRREPETGTRRGAVGARERDRAAGGGRADRAGDRRPSAHLARHGAHARAQRHGQGRRAVASAPRGQGAGRGPRRALSTTPGRSHNCGMDARRRRARGWRARFAGF